MSTNFLLIWEHSDIGDTVDRLSSKPVKCEKIYPSVAESLLKDPRLESAKKHHTARIITIKYMGHTYRIPVEKYDKPTEAMLGSIKVEKPIDDPKQVARDYIRKTLMEEFFG